VIDEALAHNLDIRGAVARVDAAAAVARLAGASLVPNTSLSSNASRRRQNLIGIPIPGFGDVISTRSTSIGVSLDVLWELDLWGRVRSGKSATLAELQASWADLAALRLSIAGQTAKAWFALVEAESQLELAEETSDSYQFSASQVRARYQQGVRSSLDLRLALSNLHNAEGLTEVRKLQRDSGIRQLEIFLGRYPSGALVAGGQFPSVSWDVPAGLPSEILIRRPDLLAAERRFAAAEKRVSEARRAFFPQITLTGSGGTLSEELTDLVKGDFSVWSIAAGITQPIFQGGRLRANLAQSHAISDQALAAYASALLNAFGEVESALFAEGALARREASVAEAAEQAQAARRLAEREYNFGLVDYITVLEAQRRAFTFQSELLSVRRERLDARVNLHLALGGGFGLTKQWREFLDTQGEVETEE
jgi:NodT family efflux transporter outer membrane factor (OMF) lipoprotein